MSDAVVRIPISKTGDPIDPEAELAPGVLGYALEDDGVIWIPLIRAASEGDGRVGQGARKMSPHRWFAIFCRLATSWSASSGVRRSTSTARSDSTAGCGGFGA